MFIINYFIIDSHCDTVLKIEQSQNGINSNNFNFNLNDALQLGGYAQFFATWVDMKQFSDTPFERANSLINTLKSEFEKNASKIIPAYSSNDIKTAFSQNKLGAVLSLEGADALESKIERLKHFYDLGIRCMSLTWNYKNAFAYGAMSNSKRGLTPLGRELVREMNRMGIIIDVSHLNEASFWDVILESSKPIMASHSCSMSVRHHRRNLTDDQFKAIAQKGGVVGLNFYNRFLTHKKTATIDDVIRHFEHFLSIGGENSIAIGSDFDGASAYPESLSSTADIENLLVELANKGHKNEIINKFSSQNMLSYISKIL